jgi:uncharacterized Tic20 family protein
MATLAHALQLIGGWIAPLIIFLIKRQSRFVSFHALQALLFQIVHAIVMIIVVMIWFVTIFSTIALHSSDKAAAPPMAFFIVFPLVWLFFMAVWVATLVIAIMYCIKASRGEWAEYPVLGRLARKILKIGPNGSTITGQL